MLNALLWSLRFSAQHNRSTYSQPHVRADSLSLPLPTTVGRLNITQHQLVWERQRPMSPRSAQQIVSCFGRIFSHLEVLTHGISSGNRIVFINTPKADIIMCISVYECTVRCVHIELCRYLYTVQHDAYTVFPFSSAIRIIRPHFHCNSVSRHRRTPG